MSERIIKVGLDIGNSSVKGSVLSQQNGLLRTILTPSCVNYIADEKHLSFPDKNTHYIQILDSPLSHSDRITAIGERAMDIPNYQQFDVGSTSYKTNHEITNALLLGLIADALHYENGGKIILAVSVPIVESKTYHLVEEYHDKLVGSHRIKVYSESGAKEIVIDIVLAQVLNEGQAGFLGLLDTVDDSFRQTMETLYATFGEGPNMIPTLQDFLVVDIGEGTTDLAVFRNKKFNAEYSYSVTKGYGTILELAMAGAEREGITIESRKQLQSLLESTNERRRAQRETWNQFMDAERTRYVDEVVGTILKSYGRQSFLDAIIFLGGGFTALTGYSIGPNHQVQMTNSYLFDQLDRVLTKNRKSASLLFGVPAPYAQTINNRGLMQVLTSQRI